VRDLTNIRIVLFSYEDFLFGIRTNGAIGASSMEYQNS